MSDRPGESSSRRVLSLGRAIRHRVDAWARLLREHELTWLAVLSSMCLLVLAAGLAGENWWPLTSFLVPLLLGSAVMSMRRLVVLTVLDTACLALLCFMTFVDARRLAAVVIVAVCAGLLLWNVGVRSRLGLDQAHGDSMLVDLRDRLVSQSQLPVLPAGWSAEAVMKSAGGASFAGDFIVASRTHDGGVLEVIVADVSGKGMDAGTRALMLSSALGGLLGSVRPEDLLPAANAYLLRQGWVEEFVTAAHVSIDLATGEFAVRTAGHPPAVQFCSGSGRWSVHWTDGPILGLLPDAEYAPFCGQFAPGDALLLYTDGLVETPSRDIAFGIDRLIGQAEGLVREGSASGATRLLAGAESERDDRALVLLVRG